MQLLKTLPFVFLTLTIFLSIPLVFGFTEEAKTFGVSGTIMFQDDSAKGARVVLTTGSTNPFVPGTNNKAFVEQYLQTSGYFYRKLTKLSGNDVSIWVKRDGYPAIQVSQVLKYEDDQINFGVVNIPAKLKNSNEKAVSFYEKPCFQGAPLLIVPNQVAAIRNFKVVTCAEHEEELYKGQVSLQTDLAYEEEAKDQFYSKNLAVLFF